MATALAPPEFTTVADLVEHLGGIPAERIRVRPQPGTATEDDVIRLHESEKRLCELVDGVLVEKAMGFYESLLAVELIRLLSTFVAEQDLGLVTGPDGMMKLPHGHVRIPDVAFISWQRLPEGFEISQKIPALAPDLAIEVLSASNTSAEMERKCVEYFDSGVRLVWYVDPKKRSVTIYRSPTEFTELTEPAMLVGGSVLPGFSLAVAEIFRRTDSASSR